MNIAVLTAVYKRPKVWQLWLQYNLPIMKDLKNHKFVIIVAGNEREHKKSLQQYCQDYQIDWLWVESDNKPVGEKFNKACRAIKEWERENHTTIDYACILGSDDLVGKVYWFSATAYPQAQIIGTNQAAVVKIDFDKPEILPDHIVHQNTPSDAFGLNQTPMLGSGRLLSRKVLVEINWTLFDRVNSGLDTSLDKRLLALNESVWLVPFSPEDQLFILVLKHGENINGWKWFQHLPTLEFPASEIKKLQQLIQSRYENV